MSQNFFYKMLYLPADCPMEFHTYEKHTGCEMAIVNQKRCCMCWAIAACDCVSMGLKIVGIHPVIVKLYSKHLLDCANPDKVNSLHCYEYGLKKAFRYIAEKGVLRQPNVPFLAEKWPCSRHVTLEGDLVKIAGYENLDCYDESSLMRAVMKYPICGAVVMTHEFCRIKGDEIYEGGNVPVGGKQSLHAIIIIGFGFVDNPDKRFWIIRNSHGTEWGNQGYGRILRKSSMSLMRRNEPPLITRTVRPLFTMGENVQSTIGGGLTWHKVGNEWYWKL